MNQSNVIFFFVFAAFFVYITIRGELPLYAGFLFAPTKSAAPAEQKTSGIDASTVVSVAKTAAAFLA